MKVSHSSVITVDSSLPSFFGAHNGHWWCPAPPLPGRWPCHPATQGWLPVAHSWPLLGRTVLTKNFLEGYMPLSWGRAQPLAELQSTISLPHNPEVPLGFIQSHGFAYFLAISSLLYRFLAQWITCIKLVNRSPFRSKTVPLETLMRSIYIITHTFIVSL